MKLYTVLNSSSVYIYIYDQENALMLFQIYGEKRRQFSLVRNNPREILEKVATDIERLLAKKRKALEVRKHNKSHMFFLRIYF